MIEMSRIPSSGELNEAEKRSAHDFAQNLLEHIQYNKDRIHLIDNPQKEVYKSYLESARNFVIQNMSQLPKSAADQIYRSLTDALQDSFLRVNGMATLKREIEEATNNVLSVAKQKEIEVSKNKLIDVISREISANIKVLFNDESTSARDSFYGALQTVFGTDPKRFPAETVAQEWKKLRPAFEEATQQFFRAAEEKATKELGKLDEPLKNIITIAVNDHLNKRESSPFYIAPARPITTELPPANLNPHMPQLSKVLSDAYCYVGNAAIREQLGTNGDSLRLPLGAGAALGILSGVAKSTNVGLAVGLGVAGASSLHVFIRDAALARADFYRQISGLDRRAELERLTTPTSQARVALCDRYGDDWLRDFETWALEPLTLSASNALDIANAAKKTFNHFLLLKSDFEKFEEDAKSLTEPEFIKEAARRGKKRYELEEKAINEEFLNTGYRCGEVDHVGIRCLSHMRDGKVSDDAKKLLEFLKARPNFKTALDIQDETAGFIRQTFKKTSGTFVWPEKSIMRRLATMTAAGSQAAIPRLGLHQRRGWQPLAGDEASSSVGSNLQV